MSLCRRFYETLVSKALSVVKFQKTEDISLKARLRSSAATRLKVDHPQSGQKPAANHSASNCNSSSSSASGSTKGKGLGIVCGVNSVAAIVQEKEKDSAARRARVTSTRLTALKTYLEQTN